MSPALSENKWAPVGTALVNIKLEPHGILPTHNLELLPHPHTHIYNLCRSHPPRSLSNSLSPSFIFWLWVQKVICWKGWVQRKEEKEVKHSTDRRLGCAVRSSGWSFFLFNCRLYLKGHTGTAGKQSSLILHGADFSTKDADNDNCMCKCALMLTGGESRRPCPELAFVGLKLGISYPWEKGLISWSGNWGASP